MEQVRNNVVKVIGAGLAGCEASLMLANLGVQVELYDIKPNNFTPAHHNPNFAELVCSNSLKSDTLEFATGVLKAELRLMGSKVLECADKCKIPSGKTLSVDRDAFAQEVTALVRGNPNIHFISHEIVALDNVPTIISTGPLTTSALSEYLKDKLGDNLYFYDAVAPIVSADSIDMSKVFVANKFDANDEGDYINCPMDRQQYFDFVHLLNTAERVPLKSFEDEKVFEGCMPVEVMSMRDVNALRCGPLKASGLVDKTGHTPYACVQLRKENAVGDSYNMVGFQTNLTFPEQKRVFRTIPGLENAEFLRYGVMHRNSYINAPKLLNHHFQLKSDTNIFFAGQISGIEGYVESIASGLIVALNMYCYLNDMPMIEFTTNTALGALSNYLESANPNNFQPMHISYGLFSPITCSKAQKKQLIAQRAIEYITKIKKENSLWISKEQQ